MFKNRKVYCNEKGGNELDLFAPPAVGTSAKLLYFVLFNYLQYFVFLFS